MTVEHRKERSCEVSKTNGLINNYPGYLEWRASLFTEAVQEINWMTTGLKLTSSEIEAG